MFRFAASLALLALIAPVTPSAQMLSADEKALAAYQLTMPTVRKVAAATKAFAEMEKKDPDVQALDKLEAEIEALESKDALTDAEQARLDTLRERAQALEEKIEAKESSGGDNETLAQMEARVRKEPAAMAILNREGLTPREYVLCLMSLFQASLIEGFSQGKARIADLPAGVNPKNLEFVRQHKAELETLMKSMEKK